MLAGFLDEVWGWSQKIRTPKVVLRTSDEASLASWLPTCRIAGTPCNLRDWMVRMTATTQKKAIAAAR